MVSLSGSTLIPALGPEAVFLPNLIAIYILCISSTAIAAMWTESGNAQSIASSVSVLSTCSNVLLCTHTLLYEGIHGVLIFSLAMSIIMLVYVLYAISSEQGTPTTDQQAPAITQDTTYIPYRRPYIGHEPYTHPTLYHTINIEGLTLDPIHGTALKQIDEYRNLQSRETQNLPCPEPEPNPIILPHNGPLLHTQEFIDYQIRKTYKFLKQSKTPEQAIPTTDQQAPAITPSTTYTPYRGPYIDNEPYTHPTLYHTINIEGITLDPIHEIALKQIDEHRDLQSREPQDTHCPEPEPEPNPILLPPNGPLLHTQEFIDYQIRKTDNFLKQSKIKNDKTTSHSRPQTKGDLEYKKQSVQ